MPLVTDRDKCAHLLRRFGLGASEAELDYYLRDGLNGAIDRLLDYRDVALPIDIDPYTLQNDNEQVRMATALSWWVHRMVTTTRPLEEKMTLFWHDHFATSASKVGQAPLMLQQNATLRSNAVGSFRVLLLEVSKDPAMIFWLDNQLNVRGKPNENFAREVMELFTLGVDQGYTEKDIQEAARAFTGWSIRRLGAVDGQPRGRAEFVFRAAQNDRGNKQILGREALFTGEQVLDLLCDHPRTAEHLTEKIWEWFAYPKPEPAVVKFHAEKFRRANLDIKELLRSIMKSSEFYSEKAERAIFKNPVDFVVPTLRQLGFGQILENLAQGDNRRAVAPCAIVANVMRSMGMWLFYPPDVAGWDHGSSWISSATMVERMAWADKLFGGRPGNRTQLRFPIFPLISEDPTPRGVASRFVELLDAPIGQDRFQLLVDAARKAANGRVTATNAARVGSDVTRLIFASPEFQKA